MNGIFFTGCCQLPRRVKILSMKYFITIVIILNFVSCTHPGKNQSDQSRREEISDFFVLDNGVKAYVIEDPTASKARFTISINAGSLDDPKHQQGLAHLLEHMLFLGSKNYPGSDEVMSFIKKSKGNVNAYTMPEHTNYYFEINPEYLNEALRRYSSMIEAPLLLEEYLKKEINAVNSEHEKNLFNDKRRMYWLEAYLRPQDHPLSNFPTGNAETLKSVTAQNLRDFFQQHYTPENMSLIIYAPKPLKELRALVKQNFGQLPKAKLGKKEIVPAQKANPRFVKMRSISKAHELNLIFHLSENPDQYWESKPVKLISHILGHEGEGSLHQMLKQEELIYRLAVGDLSNKYEQKLQVSIRLTDSGLTQQKQIIKKVLDYIELIKQQLNYKDVFEDFQKMSEYSLKYNEKKNALDELSYLANELHRHPSANVRKLTSILFKGDETTLKRYLQELHAGNLTVISMSPTHRGKKKTSIYQVEFNEEPLDHSELKLTPLSRKIVGKNEYTPRTLALQKKEALKTPVKMTRDDESIFFYYPDNKFNLPYAYISTNLHPHRKLGYEDFEIISSIWASALASSLNTWLYDLKMAGVDLKIKATKGGISLMLAGYSDRAVEIYLEALQRMASFEISEKEFNFFKRKLAKDYDKSLYNHEYARLSSEKSALISKNVSAPEAKISRLKKINFSMLKGFKPQLLEGIYFESIAYGNLTRAEANEMSEKTLSSLGSKAIPPTQALLPEDNTFAPGHKTFTFIPPKTNNNAWLGYFHFGERSIEKNAFIKVFESLADDWFFHELRTTQQIGYIVNASKDYETKSYGYSFLVQSSFLPPEEIEKRFFTWLESVDQKMNTLTEEEFHELKQSAILQMIEPHGDMNTEFTWLIAKAFTLQENFNYRMDLARLLKEYPRQKFIEDYVDFYHRMRSFTSLKIEK
jgi:insulysin